MDIYLIVIYMTNSSIKKDKANLYLIFVYKNFSIFSPMKSQTTECSLKLLFPFTIDGIERTSTVITSLEHNQGVICFSLPFNLSLTIPNANFISKEQKNSTFIYAFEFDSSIEANEWLEEKEIHVEQHSKTGDVYSLQKEMDTFMNEYESAEKNRRKKTKVVDDEGFSYFI